MHATQYNNKILEKLQILLTPDKDHKRVFPEIPIVEFRYGKILKDYLVRATLPKMDNAGGFEPCEKGTCQVCDHIITTNTFRPKAFGEVFKIQSGSLNCNSEKILDLLRCKRFVMVLLMLERLKQSFVFGLIFIKINTDLFKQENRMYHRSVFIYTIIKIATEVLMNGK